VSQQFSVRISAVGIALLLSACATKPTLPEGFYSPSAKAHLYGVKAWSLEGRIAITAKNDSWSANIEWVHQPKLEKIKLSGPLGQGAVFIELTDNAVKIDRGGGNVQTSNQPGPFINQQLGMFVPLQFLRFWVIGLPESDQAYQSTSDGFVQDGWLVAYKAMQPYGIESLPHKLAVSDARVKLKLIIDQWDLHDRKPN
jgi:outer membrane lipoprotein LolB